MTNTAIAKKVYADVFTNINKKVIAETQLLIKKGIWSKDVSDVDKAIFMGIWLKKVSEIYGMKVPKFYYTGGDEGRREYRKTGGGCYIPSHHTICLFRKPSLTTLMHEFRHAMQHQLGVKKYKGFEPDARAWSCSLYRLSAPKAYKRAVEKGLLHFK